MPVEYRPLPGRQAQRPKEEQKFAPRETAWEYFKKQAPLTLLGAALQPPMAYLGEKLTRPSITEAEIKVEGERSKLTASREKAAFDRAATAERRREGREATRTLLANVKAKDLARMEMVGEIKKFQHDLGATILSEGSGKGYEVADIQSKYLAKGEAEYQAALKKYNAELALRKEYLDGFEAKGMAPPTTGLPKVGQEPDRAEIMGRWNDMGAKAVGKIQKTMTSSQWQRQRQVDPAGAADTLYDMADDVVEAIRQDAEEERRLNYELLALNAREAGWKINPGLAKYRFDEQYIQTLVNMQTIFEKNHYKQVHANEWRREYAARDKRMDPNALMPGLKQVDKKLLQRFAYLFAPHQRKALGLTDKSGIRPDPYTGILRGEDEKLTKVHGYGALGGVHVPLGQADKTERLMHRLLGNHGQEFPAPIASKLEGALQEELPGPQKPSERVQEKSSFRDMHPLTMGEPRAAPAEPVSAQRRAPATATPPADLYRKWAKYWETLPPSQRAGLRHTIPPAILRQLQSTDSYTDDVLLMNAP